MFSAVHLDFFTAGRRTTTFLALPAFFTGRRAMTALPCFSSCDAATMLLLLPCCATGDEGAGGGGDSALCSESSESGEESITALWSLFWLSRAT